VQRYLAGTSLRESRLGLMFHAVCKIPMQFFILLLGVLLFVFYQFEAPPVYFNETAWKNSSAPKAAATEQAFAAAHAEERAQLDRWLQARHAGDASAAATAFTAAGAASDRAEAIHQTVQEAVARAPGATANDADYIFITFILHYLPHGVVGLLVAAFFAAALSSKAAELNALAATTTVDLYRHIVRRDADDAHCVRASKVFTGLWGLAAMGVALFARLAENLVQAANILGSVLYPVVLGLFLVAFFCRSVAGTAVFWGAMVAQVLVLALYVLGHYVSALDISYLWYNPLGCGGCVLFSLVLQAALNGSGKSAALAPP
jgi:Na+/proline symporter